MQITSFEKFDEVMSVLHGCPFTLSDAVYDQGAQTWTGIFLRPLWDDPRAEDTGLPFLYSKRRVPMVRASVRFGFVDKVRNNDDSAIDEYSFAEAKETADGIRLHFNEALSIDLHIKSINATYSEEPEPRTRAVYTQFLFIESGPVIERFSDEQ